MNLVSVLVFVTISTVRDENTSTPVFVVVGVRALNVSKVTSGIAVRWKDVTWSKINKILIKF